MAAGMVFGIRLVRKCSHGTPYEISETWIQENGKSKALTVTKGPWLASPVEYNRKGADAQSPPLAAY